MADESTFQIFSFVLTGWKAKAAFTAILMGLVLIGYCIGAARHK